MGNDQRDSRTRQLQDRLSAVKTDDPVGLLALAEEMLAHIEAITRSERGASEAAQEYARLKEWMESYHPDLLDKFESSPLYVAESPAGDNPPAHQDRNREAG